MKKRDISPHSETASGAIDGEVGNRIRARREYQDILQCELAESIKVRSERMCCIENGAVSVKPVELARIGKALKCNAAEFVEGLEVLV